MGWTHENDADQGKTERHSSKGPGLLGRIQRILLCGHTGTYDLVQQEANTDPNCCQVRPSRKRHKLSQDQLFYTSLYKEDLLLTHGLLVKKGETGKYVSQIVLDFPILQICLGFCNAELVNGPYNPNDKLSNSKFRYGVQYDPHPWIQIGLEKVLYYTHHQNEKVFIDGVSASRWLEIFEPVLQTLIILRRIGRRNRTNITNRKQPSPLHRNRRVVVGDVQNRYFMIGPHFDHRLDHRLDIMALFANRLAELGERTWRNQTWFFPQHDRVIPFLREHRESTRNKSKKQDSKISIRKRSLHRSKSDTHIFTRSRNTGKVVLQDETVVQRPLHPVHRIFARNRNMFH